MEKIRVGIIFGGKSGEHEVSIVSAMSVQRALDPSKYEVTMIGIDKTGRWTLPDKASLLEHQNSPRALDLSKEFHPVSFLPFESEKQLLPLSSTYQQLTDQQIKVDGRKTFDVIVPILHGTYGEDGTIQGLFELANIPYVGSGVLGSSLGMDKDASKRLFQAAGIPVVPWRTVRKHEFKKHSKEILDELEKEFSYPYFVKPANMGSSVGVHKVKSRADAEEKLKDAFCYDLKVLVEQAVAARELEISILGNHDPKASIVGEIIPTHEFYSYEAKYLDENGAKLKIPAEGLTPQQVTQLQNFAVKGFQAIECRGLARVDFFLDKNTNQLFLNEINTIPGFTSISMYPKLWAASGIPYGQLLDELIRLAIEFHQEKNELKTSFES